ncbi:MAG TPA: tetratricopeptide repeat protein, partial [Myxococcales bacterium]|nr:tetratricopeptide repeat protein [Myxococcales bacterium]
MIDPRTGAAAEGIFDEDDSDLADNAEFDRALAAGTELLAQGNPTDARLSLEKALRYKPRNQRARNLLGLSLFKLGELPRAEEIYRSLIEDHPADPTLRVNLGLVFLKSGAAPDAVRCFETALDLQPEHQKAQNYLGLALAQKGEVARAREWFLKCGNDAMAERMAQALSQSPIRDVARGAEQALAEEQPFRPAVEESEPPPAPPPLAETQPAETAPAAEEPPAKKGDTLEIPRPPGVPEAPRVDTPPVGTRWVATSPAQPAAPPVAPAVEKTTLGRMVIQNVPEPTQPPAANVAEAATESMAHYTAEKRLDVPAAEASFGIGSSEVVIHVRGEVLSRLDGLVASWGSTTLKPELKRFRGKATDKPFGDGARRMLRAAGEGRFVIAREGRHFTALELGDEPAYFREEILYAFEESILFENGRVPSKGGTDLHLVHLRGHGKLLLVTNGLPRSVDVTRGEALRIPMDQLVGWHGPLIQPRLVPIVEEAP